ncbi:hypothetical protein [Anaerohalosphaera lusitana]|uniref:hypothetical protein n=1 Tax=Anaerohalosphaera lusitana TaxID=1936003 RepID=UPI0011BA9667|nr:hypothetical protein [Anaerohalosphaera lusitana]
MTAWLRSASSRTFYLHRQEYVRQQRLKQQLWQKQLELESIISPTTISDRIEKQLEDDQAQ